LQKVLANRESFAEKTYVRLGRGIGVRGPKPAGRLGMGLGG